MTGLSKNPLAGLAALGLAGIPSNTGGLNPTGMYEEALVKFKLNLIVYYSHHSSCRSGGIATSYYSESNASSKHSATWNDCAKRFNRMHNWKGRHQDRRNSSNLRCHDSDLQLWGARRRQHRPNNHHQRQSRCRCTCSISYKHEVSRVVTISIIANWCSFSKNFLYIYSFCLTKKKQL